MIWTQRAGEKLDYRQVIRGDTVASATWSINPTGPTLGEPVNTENSSTVRVSGLSADTDYTLKPHIVGGSGQEFEAKEDVIIQAKP